MYVICGEERLENGETQPVYYDGDTLVDKEEQAYIYIHLADLPTDLFDLKINFPGSFQLPYYGKHRTFWVQRHLQDPTYILLTEVHASQGQSKEAMQTPEECAHRVAQAVLTALPTAYHVRTTALAHPGSAGHTALRMARLNPPHADLKSVTKKVVFQPKPEYKRVDKEDK